MIAEGRKVDLVKDGDLNYMKTRLALSAQAAFASLSAQDVN